MQQEAKELGVRSPGIRGLTIEQLNPKQVSSLLGFGLTLIETDGKPTGNWRLDLKLEKTEDTETTKFVLIVKPGEKHIRVQIDSGIGLTTCDIENITSVDLINYEGKLIIIRNNRGMLLVDNKGEISGRGVRVRFHPRTTTH